MCCILKHIHNRVILLIHHPISYKALSSYLLVFISLSIFIIPFPSFKHVSDIHPRMLLTAFHFFKDMSIQCYYLFFNQRINCKFKYNNIIVKQGGMMVKYIRYAMFRYLARGGDWHSVCIAHK